MEQQKGKPLKERRKYLRLEASVKVKYTVIGKPGTIKVFSKNISAGGLALLLDEQLAIDTPLQLQIKLPDLKASIRAIAQVVWQKDFESAGVEPKVHFTTGIEFTGISDFDRFNINRYVMDRIEPEA